MPKSIVIEPERVFARSTIHLSDIEVNAYQRTGEQERAAYSFRAVPAIWQDMCAIRQFETILNEIKTKGAFQGLTYNHAGPAHLSIGQEAAAVGMAFSLTSDDHIYGSHRSHGEILAKGFSAIRQWSDAQLLELMKSYRDGAILGPVEKGYKGTVKGLALRFFVYGAYSELFARETGFNRGLGGSMHAFFAPFGIYPNNAIVGRLRIDRAGRGAFQESQPQAGNRGVQHRRRLLRLRSVWEGITFSAMDQYRKLWDASLGGGLPIVFNCMNNFYGMGGQPFARPWECSSSRASAPASNPSRCTRSASTATDPLPVIDAFRRKRQVIEEGPRPGPAGYHYVPHQRTLAVGRVELPLQGRDRALAAGRFDPLLPPEDGEIGAVAGDVLDSAKDAIDTAGFEMFRLATDLEASPRVGAGSELVSSVMFSNRKVEKFDDRKARVSARPRAKPQVQQIKGKVRTAVQDGSPCPR